MIEDFDETASNPALSQKLSEAIARDRKSTQPMHVDQVFSSLAIRGAFPALTQIVHGKPLTYLDSAATALTPYSVIEAVRNAYERDNANVHRGVHTLSQRATATFESAREKVRDLIGADKIEEVIFTSGATAAINLVAQAWGGANLKPGDQVLITELEHHSNIVPWQLICERTGAQLRVCPITDEGDVDVNQFDSLLNEHTKMVAFAHVSNSLGTVLPIHTMTQLAQEVGALVFIDGCQGIVHEQVDVKAIGCDFYAFSGHKLYGPTGTGVLYGKETVLDAMPPWLGGGDMIDEVHFEGCSYADLPHKFEAGTPNIAGVAGLGAAVDFVRTLPWESVVAHEAKLLALGTELLASVEGLRLIGNAQKKDAVLSFVVDGVHPTDLGTILDTEGVAVRTGHHCAQPVMRRFGINATARVSLGIYNNEDDLRRFGHALKRALGMLR